MDKETWEFINTFAPWLSAIGTFLAVIVSLYIAFRKNKIQLRISAKTMVTVQPPAENEDVLYIDIVNISDKLIEVLSIMWQIGIFKKKYFFQADSNHPYSTKLPSNISYGKGIRYIISLDLFKANLPEFEKVISGIFRKIKVRSMKIVVNTSVGKNFTKAIDSSLREWILSGGHFITKQYK